jgi:hypothetical protein
MGVSFGEVIGDVPPEGTDATVVEPQEKAAQPAPIDQLQLRRELRRIDLRQARLRST